MHDIPHIQAKMILTKLYKQITFQSVCPICPGSWPLNLLKCLSNLSWLLATKIHVHQLLISAYIKIALKPSFTYSCIQVLGQLINKYKHHVYLNQSNPNHTYIYVMRLRLSVVIVTKRIVIVFPIKRVSFCFCFCLLKSLVFA